MKPSLQFIYFLLVFLFIVVLFAAWLLGLFSPPINIQAHQSDDSKTISAQKPHLASGGAFGPGIYSPPRSADDEEQSELPDISLTATFEEKMDEAHIYLGEKNKLILQIGKILDKIQMPFFVVTKHLFLKESNKAISEIATHLQGNEEQLKKLSRFFEGDEHVLLDKDAFDTHTVTNLVTLFRKYEEEMNKWKQNLNPFLLNDHVCNFIKQWTNHLFHSNLNRREIFKQFALLRSMRKPTTKTLTNLLFDSLNKKSVSNIIYAYVSYSTVIDSNEMAIYQRLFISLLNATTPYDSNPEMLLHDEKEFSDVIQSYNFINEQDFHSPVIKYAWESMFTNEKFDYMIREKLVNLLLNFLPNRQNNVLYLEWFDQIYKRMLDLPHLWSMMIHTVSTNDKENFQHAIGKFLQKNVKPFAEIEFHKLMGHEFLSRLHNNYSKFPTNPLDEEVDEVVHNLADQINEFEEAMQAQSSTIYFPSLLKNLPHKFPIEIYFTTLSTLSGNKPEINRFQALLISMCNDLQTKIEERLKQPGT